MRKIGRFVLGALGGLAGISAMACSADAGAGDSAQASESQSLGGSPSYLALGDSIAFGDNGYIPWNDPSRHNVAQFEGYPMEVAEIAFGGAAHVWDLGCPGETTGSFLDANAPDNGCHDYKSRTPSELHVPYTSTQMDAALAYLASHRVSFVSINLGGNDLLLAQYGCLGSSNFLGCVAQVLPGVIAKAAENVATIGLKLRAAGYTGEIVFLTQYATNYQDATQLAAIPAFNAAVASAIGVFGGKLASGFDAFALASAPYGGDPCKAGLLIPSPTGDGTCDKHPSEKGRELLGLAVLLAR